MNQGTTAEQGDPNEKDPGEMKERTTDSCGKDKRRQGRKARKRSENREGRKKYSKFREQKG